MQICIIEFFVFKTGKDAFSKSKIFNLFIDGKFCKWQTYYFSRYSSFNRLYICLELEINCLIMYFSRFDQLQHNLYLKHNLPFTSLTLSSPFCNMVVTRERWLVLNCCKEYIADTILYLLQYMTRTQNLIAGKYPHFEWISLRKNVLCILMLYVSSNCL